MWPAEAVNVQAKREDLAMNRITKVAVAATLAAALAGVAGCSGTAAGENEPVVMWTMTQPSLAQQVVEDQIAAFNESYPGGGKVSIQWIGGEAIKDKMSVAMAANQPPTIFFTFGGELLSQYVDAGTVEDLSPAFDADPEWKAAYTATNVFDLATHDGKIYGVPGTGPDFEVMWQNKAVLRDAGAADSPSTWPEFLAAAEAVKASGVSPITLAGKDLWTEMIWMQYLTLRYGGTATFDKIKAAEPDAWSDPGVLKAAAEIQNLVRAGYFVDRFNTISFNSGGSSRIMADGEAAFQAMLYYDAANMRVFAPEFAASPDYSPIPFPSIPGEAGEPGVLVGQPAAYYAVSARASDSQKEQAIAWLKFLTTSDEFNIEFLANNGYTPLTQPAADALADSDVPGSELLKVLFDMASSAPAYQSYWDQDLPSAVITPMLTNIGELFDLAITPEEFADRMNTVMDELPS
jgi:ABC-type glycerol-3-phosphate transport system substrate-binding protein